jgi:hypothetical protein
MTIKEIKSLKDLGADVSAVIYGDVDAWHLDFVTFGNRHVLFTSQDKRRVFSKFETALLTAREVTEKITVEIDYAA